MSLDLGEKLSKAANRGRAIWAVTMIIAAVGFLAFLPLHYIFLIIPLGIFLYYLIFLAIGIVVSRKITDTDFKKLEEEQRIKTICDKLASEKYTPEEALKLMQEAGIVDVVVVDQTSEPIGQYQGKDIFEWVIMKSPKFDQPAKFLYHGPAEVSDGTPIIPAISGLLFACIDGILYYCEVIEPDQTNVQQPTPSV
ncbi:hypothetical protein [Acinetobacter sp.]|uniref:hypothetical protein n=1 Tax=Acinetobacter sp. TaxID=472 RepID=UPI0038902708